MGEKFLFLHKIIFMAYYSTEIREEELKNKVASEWFGKYDTTKIVGNVDFCVSVGEKNLVWGEAKRGAGHDIYESFVQLILTIGKARTFDDYIPPSYLCAFDAEKIAFIEYSNVLDIFYQNDFNWNVPPSNHKTKEFKQLKERVIDVLEREKYLYNYEDDEDELLEFIDSLELGHEDVQVQIDKNNFTHIYHKWRAKVMPSIAVNWDVAKDRNIVSSDFYIADVLAQDNMTLKDSLNVVLRGNHYELNKKIDESGLFTSQQATFKDDGRSHEEFWKIYKRPPREEYWNYIIERRDLLVPADIRERKGSFFTPRIWVEKSQEYLARVLGEDWQEEYYVWDCCAGTGNLLAGLTEKTHLFASTIDLADVKVMQELRVSGALNLFENHIFQFDFLNDSFDKLPENLQDIINDAERRKKLIIYINPPYAEAAGLKTPTGTGKNKAGVAKGNVVNQKYKSLIKGAANEMYALFLIRIFKEIQGCKIGNFSTIKLLQGQNFAVFLDNFTASLKTLFVLPAYTFDNVKGHFPIGFYVWDTAGNKPVKKFKADVYDKKNNYLGKRVFGRPKKEKYLLDWANDIKGEGKNGNGKKLAFLSSFGNDVLHQRFVCIVNDSVQMGDQRGWWITPENVVPMFIFLAVRQVIRHNWLNNRNQYYYPKDTWKKDIDFQTDCLVYTLFHTQNRITSAQGVNHFIPFNEDDLGVKQAYKSHFLIDYISGKSRPQNVNLFDKESSKNEPLVFSDEAQAVMDSARELYKYYHQQDGSNADASFYDIRLYFQGVDAKGRMNTSSNNETYNGLLQELRTSQKILAKKIEGKVYEHGFLEE